METKLQVGVKIFIKNKDNKILLVRRSTDKYKNVSGEWDIVGGRINPGSKLIDNLKREVMEETKLSLVTEPILVCAQDIIPNEEKHVVRLSYVGEAEGEIVLDTEENVEYKWLTLEEIKVQENLDKYVAEIINNNLLSEHTS